MKQSCNIDEWTEVKGPFTATDLRELRKRGAIDRLAITNQPQLTTVMARELGGVGPVDQLWLWCEVPRGAMKYVVAIRGLRVLDLLALSRKSPGMLSGFANATSLQEFRCNDGLTEADLIEIASCRSLRQVSAQWCNITPAALDALLQLPQLESLDLEASSFNDDLTARLHKSASLRSLELGNNPITRGGLENLAKLKQLRRLDLWATKITEADLDLLTEMPQLEYLSIGKVYGDERQPFSAETLLPRLRAIGSLKQIWLDGIRMTDAQRAQFEEHFEQVRIMS